MSETKHYDTKVKAQFIDDSQCTYKPNYFRLIVSADNIHQAKEAAHLLVAGALTNDDSEDNYNIQVTKCNYVKIAGCVDAKKILNNKNKKQ